MIKRVECAIPLNRVEGDLELRVAVEEGRIVDAWSSGTMYRGFERILQGRGALDGLVITPRICGICSLTHLTAAARALDHIAQRPPPANATRLRNLALMVETIQSDARHALLMYMGDFAHPAFAEQPWHGEAVTRYQPLRGERAVAAVRETRQLLEIIALIGGQWPHTSFMVPGGVVYAPPIPDLHKALQLLAGYRRWYEETVLGCSLAAWRQLTSAAALDDWLTAEPRHRQGDVGFLLRTGRAVGLDRLGRGHGRFLSYGALEIPEGSTVAGGSGQLLAAGFARGTAVTTFDQGEVAEEVACSWYADYPGGRHPLHGVTDPVASGAEGRKYSWVKAPRYAGEAAETGPLAERVMAGDPLFLDLLRREDGPTALTRQLARMIRTVHLAEAAEQWLREMIADHDAPFYLPVPPLLEGEGVGLTQAARGALGHWVRIKEGRITHYQIITPTAWNGSPRDGQGVRGAWEEALLGTPVPDPEDPVLAGLVLRSFDPCLVCSVHVVGGGGGRWTF